MQPVWKTSPPWIGLPSALIRPALSPISARCETYFTIALAVALMESRLSPHSINTQKLNCRVGVRTPAMIGVGREILKVDTDS